jgi:prepilin-type N-terminal cleavage/methylation domain-containing protein
MILHRRGFTLMELLVVMSIIGILSGIVLAALTSARNRSFDVAVKDNLGHLRTQAGLYHDNNSHYGDGIGITPTDCFTPVTSMFQTDPVIESMIDAAEDASRAGNVQCTTDASPGTNANAWSAEAPLIEGGSWCVDSEGAARVVTAPAASGVCPAS